MSGEFLDTNVILYLLDNGPKADRAEALLAQGPRISVQVLNEAITAGGTTLRDFVGSDGRPGYFAQQLRVYGRAEAPCRTCDSPIRHLRQAQRSSYFCPRCQR